MCSPRSDGVRWGGCVGGAGCFGDAVAQGAAPVHITVVDGITATCGDEGGGSEVPASEATGEHVKSMLGFKGSS